MNTDPKHTAEQLRLAASILETGHPWHLYRAGKLYDADPKAPPQYYASCPAAPEGPFEIRPALATPPDDRPLHNPDNLTAEQVGIGYRLTLKGEPTNLQIEQQEFWSQDKWIASGKVYTDTFDAHQNARITYRLPLSVPWPDAPEGPDPYAKLKAAHAAGKTIQYPANGMWFDIDPPNWTRPAHEYRIKPEDPPFHLPPPPPGMQWHREDGWEEGDLPHGMRPLVLNEGLEKGDELLIFREHQWEKTDGSIHSASGSWNVNHYRTTRPLTFTHAGKEWTYHRPGDPMPCDGEARIECVFADYSLWTDGDLIGRGVSWRASSDCSDIIGWRYADPETKEVELGPEDVPPGSVFGFKNGVWIAPLCVSADGVGFPETEAGKPLIQKWSFAILVETAKINRSLPLTGKWNPDAWKPCKKTVTIEKP